MVNRVELINVAANHVRFPAAKGVQYNKQLNKALALVLAELPLEKAREFSNGQRAELESTLTDILTLADLKKISKKWEPKRALGTSTQTEVCVALTELLRSEREPYVPSALTLVQAVALGESEKATLIENTSHYAPPNDLKKLAKKWDKFNPSLAALPRAKMATDLVALLSGQMEPTPKPQRPRR